MVSALKELMNKGRDELMHKLRQHVKGSDRSEHR